MDLDTMAQALAQAFRRELDQKMKGFEDRINKKLEHVVKLADRNSAQTCHVFDQIGSLCHHADVYGDHVIHLAIQVAAIDSNMVARMQNNGKTRPEDQIAPLYAIATNEPIQGFPATVGYIDNLTAPQADYILSLLCYILPPDLGQKKYLVKQAAGLFWSPCRFCT